MLTTDQLVTLRAAIDAETDPAFVTARQTGNNGQMLAWYNAPAVPAFIVWQSPLSRNVVGKAFQASALAAITAGNNDKLNNFAQWNDVVDPARQDQRDFFDDVFSVAAGATTRAKLYALWRTSATRAEKLYATGTGTDAAPATRVVVGPISIDDIRAAVAL